VRFISSHSGNQVRELRFQKIFLQSTLWERSITQGESLYDSAQNRTHPGASSTVAILNDTWNFENNEMPRSIAFAQKADEEAYSPVASRFSGFRSG